MALNEQMKEAIQADIADTRSKKERIDEQMGALKTAGKTAVENIPGVGEAILAKDIAGDVSEEKYASAALGAAALGVGLLPGGDILNKPIKAAAKKFRNADIKDAEELAGNVEKLEQWRKNNKLPESQRQKNIPEAEQAAEDLFQNKIKSREARKKIKEVFPEPKLYTAETMPEMPTVTDVVGSMGKKSEKGILGVKGFDLEPGQRVGARLDIPAYNEYDKWVVSIHDGKVRNGSVVGYGQAIRLKNIEFGSDPKVALDIAKGKRVAKSTGEEKPMGKATIARVFGDYVPEDPYELQQFAKKVLTDKDSGWTQVGMNPYRGSYFYDKATGTPVTRADEVIQVGPLVLAKNVTKPKMSELKEMFKPAARTAEGKLRLFNEGGAVMDKQMDLFEPVERGFDDGGLMQEGGSVDPVSGNDVPVGSTQEEVRDDIPAQLSEGEFVFPADVVRYIGLENLMRMRQEAKMGLAQMEDMGQMGNSEEATMPDDLPFDMYDLEVEDDGVQEFAQGGVVKAQAGTFVAPNLGMQQQTSQFAGYQPQYTPYTPPPVPTGQPLTQQYTPPTQQFTPTQTGTVPSFTSFTTPQSVTYYNADGRTIQIPVDANGNPLIPVPAGFTKTKPDTTTDITKGTGTGSGGISVIQNDDDSEPKPLNPYEQEIKDVQGSKEFKEVYDLFDPRTTTEKVVDDIKELYTTFAPVSRALGLRDTTSSEYRQLKDEVAQKMMQVPANERGALAEEVKKLEQEGLTVPGQKIPVEDMTTPAAREKLKKEGKLTESPEEVRDVTVETTQVTKTGKATDVIEKGIAEYSKQLGITPEEMRKQMEQSPDVAKNVERIGQLVEKGATVEPAKPSATPAETKRIGTDTYGLNDDFTIRNSQDISKNRRDAGTDPYKDDDVVYTSEVYNPSTGRTETIEYNVHGIGKNSRGQTTFASGKLKTDARGKVVNAEIPGSRPSGGRDDYANDSGSGTSSDGPSGGYDAGDTYSGASDDFTSSGDWGGGGIGAPGLAKGGLAKQMEKSGLTPKK